MTTLTHWIQSPAARALGWTLFHFLWEGIVIAAALAVVLLFVKTARLRYAAACLALMAMLCGCFATFVRVLPGEARTHAPAARLLPPPSGDAGRDAARTGSHWRTEDVLPWAAPVWLAGVLLLHLRTIARWMAVRRLCRSGVCLAPAPWRERLARLEAGVRLSIPVTLLESCRIDVPLVVGYLRPVILIPLGMLAGMPAAHVEAILLHELAHIRRRDYLVNLAQAVAENLLFYHPAVWWISGVIRTEREHCCDDLVVAVRGNAFDYAVALTNLEESRWTGEPALAATGGDLMKRIHRLLNRPQPPHAALTPALSASLILVTTALALTAWQPKPQPQESAPQTAMSPYEKWIQQDVAYIVTDEERAAFRRLPTDPERERFIEQFWLRRDPTPGTPANEFKEEHYRRIQYANQRFQDPMGLSGWKTDRGRVYISYGPPDEIESHPTGSSTKPYPYEQWLYRHLDGIGDNVVIEFTDADKSGQYRMTADPGRAIDASVARDAIWADTVKRGVMLRKVRGLGTLGENGLAEVKIAASQVRELRLGQTAAVDLRSGVVSGRVARIEPGVAIQLDAPPPATATIGQQVDVAIDIETLPDVVYVGRPVFAEANAVTMLYRIEPDGQHAVRVPVRFGRVSVNQIEVVSGLAPGDRIILSDMSQYKRFDRVRLH